MAMLITKFNKLIQSKVVWITFVSLIVIAFVFLYTPTAERRRDHEEAMSAGQLFGEHVSFDEFRRAYNNTYLQLVMFFGEPFQITPELDEQITQSTWRRLVSLRIAEGKGLRATDEEVVSALHTHPAFVSEGQFDRRIYDAFHMHFLRPMGISPQRFEQHIREEIILQKLRRLVGRNVLIAPSELERAFGTVGDEFTIEYTWLQPGEFQEEVELTDEDVIAYFEAHQDMFTLPARVQVEYVRFSVEDYREKVEVSEDEAYDYYERNLDEFTVYEDTADPLEPFDVLPELYPGDEPQDEFRIATPLPFEDVQDEILERLNRRAARDRAAREATDFMLRLVPGRDGRAPAFAELAEEHALALHSTPPFAQDEQLEDIDAGSAFNRMAFDLRPTPNDYFSNVVMGDDYVYVMALKEQFPPRAPEFEEVADRVREAALNEAIENAIQEWAESFREAAKHALNEGKTFASIADAFGLETRRLENFTAMDDPEGADEFFDYVLQGILHHNEGEITDPVEVNDRLIIIHVEQRKPADEFQLGGMRPQIINALSGERSRVMFEKWQDYMLKYADFKAREEPLLPENGDDDRDDRGT